MITLTPVSSGITRSVLPDSGIHPAPFTLAFPWLYPNVWSHVYPERAGIPKTRGGCHSSLGSSGEISISHSGVSCGHRSTRLRQSLYDLARDGGLFRTPQVSLPDSPPLICVLTTRHTPHLGKANLRRSCAPSDYISSRQLCTQQRGRTSIWIYTQSTPNSARSHYDINSGIHIYLTTINNASLSHNSKYVRLLQERTLNKPDFPRHHRRPPPVKAAISHGDSRDSLSYSELPSTNCFVHNI